MTTTSTSSTAKDAPHAAAHEELHGRVETDREEHRHHEQDQDRGDAEQLLAEEDRDEGTQRTEEADVERRVAQERGVLVGGLDRDVRRGAGVVDHEVGGVIDAFRDLGGRSGRLLGGVGCGLRTVGLVACLLDHVPEGLLRGLERGVAGGHRLPEPGPPAQDSSSSKPATTSRRAPSWAVIASRRLVTRSTSAWMLASSRSASATPRRADRVRLGARRGDDLLGLATGAGQQSLGLGLRLLAVGVGLRGGLAGALLRGAGAVLGLVRPGAGSRPWRCCGGRWPRGRAAPSRRPGCGAPPGPRGRQRRGPARPRASRSPAARWSPAGRPAGAGRTRGGRRPAGPRPRPWPGCARSRRPRSGASASRRAP